MKISVLVSLVFGWGRLGHQVIGDIATAFLTQQSKDQLAILFPAGYSLGNLGMWADYSRRNPKYAWSAVYHYVNTKNNQQGRAEFDEKRDCPDGKCVVGAIGKYTTESSCNLPVDTRQEAFLFLIHFIAETSQPLHVCGRDGGVQTTVFIDGIPSNFHSLWDNVILQKRILRDFKDSLELYVQFLFNAITNTKYKDVAHTWLSKHDVSANSPFGNSLAAIDWIRDTMGPHGSTCIAVWRPYDKKPLQDFGTKYYKDHAFTVDLQLAKAGYRLAHHLNQIFKNC